MKICVLVKQVADKNDEIKLNSEKSSVDKSNFNFVTNESDNYAVEEALLIKEKLEGEVVVCSFGRESSVQVIKDALSKGADRGIFIENDTNDEYDILNLSKIFNKTLKDENFDLILSGLQSDDMGMGQTGVLVGELLGMTTATLAIETDIDKEKIRVKRELESGWFQWVTLDSPSSISIQSGINQPRYPSLKGIMGAKKKEIKVVPSQSPDKKQSIDKVFIPQTSKETEVIDTDLNSTVERIVEILKSEVKVF